LFYTQMFALPLIGWTMLSAGGHTISLVGSVHLPRPVGFDPALFALMRQPYTLLALIHFLTILMYFGAGPFHAWVRRAGVFRSMVPRR
jgi:cytochrome b561